MVEFLNPGVLPGYPDLIDQFMMPPITVVHE